MFTINDLGNGKCSIKYNNKTLVVKATIDDINVAWFRWQMKGQFIQDAFHFLSADEREFLQTGMFGYEFDALHKEE